MDDAQNQPEAQTQARQQRRLPDFDTLRAGRRARILLEQRDLPIGEIALQLGYFDACHFSRAFRARTGLSPRQYRARL